MPVKCPVKSASGIVIWIKAIIINGVYIFLISRSPNSLWYLSEPIYDSRTISPKRILEYPIPHTNNYYGPPTV